MLANGLLLVIDMALEGVGDPLATRHRDALCLGSLREDVRRVPLFNVVYEHLSFTHLTGEWLPGGFLPLVWLGPGTMADRFYGKAVAEARAGRMASAFVQLGRAAHILSDMACPVHVHRVIHETDPYEWWIETRAEELRALPLPVIPPASRPSVLVSRLARITQAHEPDRTHSAIGRFLRRFGLRAIVSREVVAEQARTLIPQAAAHAATMIRMFLHDIHQDGMPGRGAAHDAGRGRHPVV